MSHQETVQERQLDHLRTRLLTMCAQVEQTLLDVEQTMEDNHINRAAAIMDGDSDINALENELDTITLQLMVCVQPVAKDLRFVVGAMQMANQLERIGDEATSIAAGCMLLHETSGIPVMQELTAFLRRAHAIFTQVVSAFRDDNTQLAFTLAATEDDALQREVRCLQLALRQFLQKNLHEIRFMQTILLTHAITRIWQHAVNMAEQTCFICTGENLKHRT